MTTLLKILARLAAAFLAPWAAIFASEVKPNIVFIIADDLGWMDVAFHGGNAPTPHLDKLAREGVEFTQHYVAATCTPTRVGFLTGRFWSRFGILAPYNNRALPWDTVTLPSALKRVGYDTALFGKWHVGAKPEWGRTATASMMPMAHSGAVWDLTIISTNKATLSKPGTTMET